VRDPTLQRRTLTTTNLQRGRRRPKIVFFFEEIESILVGNPARLPWFMRWTWFLPSTGFAHAVGCSSIFVRLRGGRGIPLNFVMFHFRDGGLLMQQFVRINADKVVGQEAYTEQELRGIERAKLDRVFVV